MGESHLDRRIGQPAITVGAGRHNPQGTAVLVPEREDVVEAWREQLAAIPEAECAWWSPHLWSRDYAVAADWVAAHGCAIDLDYEDPRLGASRAHTEVPIDAWLGLYQAALDGDLPGNLIHGTPRGARLIFVFAAPTTSRLQMAEALRACAEIVTTALQKAGLERIVPRVSGKVAPGFVVDRACLDLKRIFWAPRCTVAGAPRSADVHVICREPFDPADLASEAPAKPEPAERTDRESSDYTEAADRWCQDHPVDFAGQRRVCPACGHRDCFGPMPQDPDRWFCFSANHEADSGGLGQRSEQGWWGDALDLEAHRRSVTPAEILRQDGYLAEPNFGNVDISGLLSGSAPAAAAPPSQQRFQIQSLEAVLQLRPPPAIVRGLIREQDLVVLYGAPGCGKSFAAISLALSLASGTPWLGLPVSTPAPVLYIAGEGTYGIGKRVMAWAGGEIALQSALWAHWGQINDLVPMLDGRQFQALLDSIGEQPIPPRLIVVDTLARAMTGGDENSAKDMGMFVHRCGQLRDATGAAVLLVHHTRTDGERERGSSALRGAADVMLQLDRDEAGNVILSTVKTKDDQPPEPLELRLERVVLGLDEEGEEISSLRVVPLPPGSPRASDLGGSPLVVLGALTSAPKGAPWLSITDLCGATKLHRDTVRKVLRQLEEVGKIIVEQRGNMTRSRARPDQV